MTRASARLTAASLAALLVLAGCGTSSATFSPDGPCVADGQVPGAYPQLEALLPKGMLERSPDRVDSGRNCTEKNLGTLASHGVSELRFAGAIWESGERDGTTVAVLERPGARLPVAWVEEFYEAGARASSKTSNTTTKRYPDYPGIGPLFMLETLNDLSLQTVAIWATGDRVAVVIVATQVGPDAIRAEHDRRVSEAITVAAGMPALAPPATATS